MSLKQIEELKKRQNLQDFNMRSCLQNMNQLSMEVERMRKLLASKDEFKDLSQPLPLHVHSEGVSSQPSTQTSAQSNASNVSNMPNVQNMSANKQMKRGPSQQGRTLKVINN